MGCWVGLGRGKGWCRVGGLIVIWVGVGRGREMRSVEALEKGGRMSQWGAMWEDG